MLHQSQAWFLCFDGRAEGEDCRRPILIKLIKPAPFKELQPHATKGEEEKMKLQGKKRSLPASTLLQSHPSPADP